MNENSFLFSLSYRKENSLLSSLTKTILHGNSSTKNKWRHFVRFLLWQFRFYFFQFDSRWMNEFVYQKKRYEIIWKCSQYFSVFDHFVVVEFSSQIRFEERELPKVNNRMENRERVESSRVEQRFLLNEIFQSMHLIVKNEDNLNMLAEIVDDLRLSPIRFIIKNNFSLIVN